MALSINHEIVEQATECTKKCRCLSSKGKPLCKIGAVVGQSVYFTCGETPRSCTYQQSFGHSFMCTCPVRQEIYRKYKI